MSVPENVRLQLVIIGNSAVGKTSLVQRFFNADIPNFHITTIGVDFVSKSVVLSDTSIAKVTVWDTAGQERFATITKQYYRSADGCIFVYDITDQKSFERVKSHWFTEVKQSTNAKNFVLIGNKCDLSAQRVVPFAHGEALAKELGCAFFETSVISEKNQMVSNAFTYLIEETAKAIKTKGPIAKPRQVQVAVKKRESDCCAK
jgi:Ras-related protein Rab-1A